MLLAPFIDQVFYRLGRDYTNVDLLLYVEWITETVEINTTVRQCIS